MNEPPQQMNPGGITVPERLRRVVALILVAGLASAAVLWVTAPPPSGEAGGYRPEESKRYLREMEVYGGKSNLLATDLRQWFESLWHGRSLAFTVASLTLLLAFLVLFLGTPLPPAPPPSPGASRDRDGPAA